jgi:hypothetical protein
MGTVIIPPFSCYLFVTSRIDSGESLELSPRIPAVKVTARKSVRKARAVLIKTKKSENIPLEKEHLKVVQLKLNYF